MKKLFLLALVGGLLVARPGAAQAPSGAALLQKAATLEKAGNLPAAVAAYNQANAAFGKTGDIDGKLQALKKLTELNERLADQYLQQAGTGTPAVAAVAPARPAPAPRPAALARPVAAPPAVALGQPVAGRVVGGMPGAPLPGRLAGGKPQGLFFFMDVFNRQDVYYFTPDGRVYRNPASFTAEGLAAVDPQWRGAFAINGAQMTVKWDGRAPQTRNYRFDPTGFEWDGSFVCVGPFASAQQLSGSFEGHNDAIATDANTLSLYRTLRFLPNGTFTRDLYAAAHLETNGGKTTDAASASNQAGHWTLNGWYLSLTDARGTVRGVALRTDWDEKTDKTLRFYFNGTSYKATN